MEFGVSTHPFANERLGSHVLDKILAIGVRQIEIFAARQHLDYRDTNQVRDVGMWFQDHGVELCSLHAPIFAGFDWGRSGELAISIAHLEKRLRIESMDEIKYAIEVAEHLPFRYVILHLGFPGEEYDLRKFDAAFSSIEHLRLFARERWADVMLENMPNELASPDRLLEFTRYTHLEDLKLCFDTGHANMTGGVRQAFEKLRDKVAVAHLHDNQGNKDDHLFPFEGSIDWSQTVKDFRGAEQQFPLFFDLRYDTPEGNNLSRLRQIAEKMEAIQ